MRGAGLRTRVTFNEMKFLDERTGRRQPHILTFEEHQRLLAIALPPIRMAVVLITETGLRIGKEAFPLKWEDVDLVNGVIPIRKSKTPAGQRGMPLSEFCQADLLRWRQLVGPEFSPYVFPNLKNPSRHVKSLKKTWRSALRKAKIPFFPIYNLRARFGSRLNATGASDLFVAQMLGTPPPAYWARTRSSLTCTGLPRNDSCPGIPGL